MADELTIETVTAVAPTDLDENQTTFLQEHAEELTDEQKETFKDALTKKDDAVIDPEKIEIVTRVKEEVKPKDKEGEDGDEDLDPDDEAKIGKIVKKELESSPALRKLENEAETNAFIAAKPEFAKYKGVILKHMEHKDYKNIPVHYIAAMVAAGDLQKMGAQKEREAAAAAAATQNKGSQVRKGGGKVDWVNAPKDQYELQRSQVLGRQGS